MIDRHWRKRECCRRRGGQATLIFMGLVIIPLACAFLLSVLGRGIGHWRQTADQTRADLVTLSGCSALAAALNKLARFNKRIGYVQITMDGLIVYWNGLAVCAAGCVVGVGCPCVAEFARASRWVPQRLRTLSKLGKGFELAQDTIRGAVLFSIKSEMRRIAQANHFLNLHLLGGSIVAVKRAGRKPVGNLSGLITAHPIFNIIRYPRKLFLLDSANTLHRIAALKKNRHRTIVSACRVKGEDLEDGRFEEVLTK